MTVKRIVSDIHTPNPSGSRQFYGEFLGLELAMDQGWVMTWISSVNPSAQVTVIQSSADGTPEPDMSVEVDDVHKHYADAQQRGLAITYPLTDEPWGVTRFFVIDPNGKTVNILSHTTAAVL